MVFGKVIIPVMSLVIGGLIKLVLNIVLISNPNINIYGATIGSIACQGIAFIICFAALRKHIKMKISLINHVLKPIFAAGIMGAVVWGVHYILEGITGNMIATLMAIFTGVIVYGVAIVLMRCLNKEDYYMLPFGEKIYGALVRFKLYR